MVISIKSGQTDSIRDEVSRAYDIDDMREILHKYSGFHTSWKRFINELLSYYGFSVSSLAQACGFSRNTVRKWRDNGDMPRSRKEFIKLGFGIGMSLDELNDLLQRYGKYPKLYAKSVEDAIYIYSLSHGKSFAQAEELSRSLLAYFKLSAENSHEDVAADYESTAEFQQQIHELNRDQELLSFIDEHKAVFNRVYSGLTAYLDSYIIRETVDYTATKNRYSLNAFLGSKVSSSLVVGHFNDMVSMLRTRKIIPNRLRLVALGIHLDMTVEEIDKLLELANMERLCPKDKVECAVIFAVENLMLNDHDDLVGGLLERLEAEPSTKQACLQIIDKYRRMDEDEADYGQTDIAAYLSDTLRTLDIEQAQEMLDLLR